MSLGARELYISPNGDCWFLLYDSETGDVLIHHRPNAASGGRSSLIPVGQFLARETDHPEHQALLRLIGSLVEQDNMAEDVDPASFSGVGLADPLLRG
jgi:hypothetical protein